MSINFKEKNKFHVYQIVSLLIGLILGLFIFGPYWLKGEVEIYFAEPCSECQFGMLPGSIWVFKPDNKNQTVFLKTKGWEVVEKYDDCTVYDKKNWICKEPNQLERDENLELRNGKFYSSYVDSETISRSYWLLLKLSSYF